MRRQGASIFIYLIFGLLIVIFVINFAPSGQTGSGGCNTSGNTVVTVDGVDANQSAYLVAYSANSAGGRQKVYIALDQVIRRELLAQAAEERGIRTTGELIDQQIITTKRGYFYLGGQRIDVTRQFFDEVDGEFLFNRKRWVGWISSLNIQSPGTYREEQARGLQAAMMSDLITKSVRVSRDEALANYLYENNTVTYDVVSFDPAKYRRAMKLTDADTKRFLDSHGDEVQAKYKADERTYKGVKPQLEVREIFIPKAMAAAKPAETKPAEGATPADPKPADGAKPAEPAKPAEKKPAAGSGEAVKPFGLPIEVAQAKLEAVRASIAAGKLTFPDAEKQLAADSSEDAPAQNGYHGWRSVETPELGEAKLNEAVKALKPGEMTPVIVGERGAYLVIVTGKREGDLSFDQVKTEIAVVLAKETWSKEAAKREALDTLAKAQAGTGKNLDQMFERELTKPSGGGNGLEDMLKNPDLDPQVRKQIEDILKQQQMPPPKQGAIELHEQDVPVAWYADPDGSSAPAVAIVPTNEVLPQFGEVPKARINRLGPAPRQSKMPGLGNAKGVSEALFDELAAGNLAKQVYEGDGGAYVVLQLINKAAPKVDEFDKTADAEIARMQEARGKAAIHEWLKGRCETLTKANKIRPAPDRIQETDDKGNPAPTVYHPCMYLDILDR
ncbi:MAG: SurA N-terminal domain-containing protein [Myxococcales bacterium]|nr:SurA N-terminal domain-containing protein [Myxococcales bacterium]